MSLEPMWNALTFEVLEAKGRDVWNTLSDKLRLRMRRGPELA